MDFIPAALKPHLRRFGLSGLLALALIGVMLAGINPITLISGKVAPPKPLTSVTGVPLGAAGPEQLAAYPSIVAGEADTMWRGFFRQASLPYSTPTMKVGESSAGFGCGLGGRDLTVFYCPADATIYVDISAYKSLRDRFTLGADYAMAHLVAEAYGQHAQAAIGQFDKVMGLRQAGDAAGLVTLSQQLDEQAQCHAAMWTSAAGIAPFTGNAAVQAALADVDARRISAAAGVEPADVIPVLLSRASGAGRAYWYDKGYAIPAAGTCRIEKIIASGEI